MSTFTIHNRKSFFETPLLLMLVLIIFPLSFADVISLKQGLIFLLVFY